MAICLLAVARSLFSEHVRVMVNQVRKLRRDRDITLEALSEMTGISTSYLSRIESNKRNLSLANVIAIARALGVDPEKVSDEFHQNDLEIAQAMAAKGPGPKEGGDVPNFTIHAGMGPGGALSVLKNDNGEIYGDQSDGFWSFPDAVKSGWGNLSRIYAMPVTGDSMEPTLPSGSFVFVDTSHTVPSPEDIYAIDYGDGLMVKRVKLIPRTEMIRIMSDNARYDADELHRAEVRVYGRVVAWFQWRG